MQGSTALHQAAMHGHAKVVQSLMEYGADANARTADVNRSLLLLLLFLCCQAAVCHSTLDMNIVCQTSALYIQLIHNIQFTYCFLQSRVSAEPTVNHSVTAKTMQKVLLLSSVMEVQKITAMPMAKVVVSSADISNMHATPLLVLMPQLWCVLSPGSEDACMFIVFLHFISLILPMIWLS